MSQRWTPRHYIIGGGGQNVTSAGFPAMPGGRQRVLHAGARCWVGPVPTQYPAPRSTIRPDVEAFGVSGVVADQEVDHHRPVGDRPGLRDDVGDLARGFSSHAPAAMAVIPRPW